MREEWSNKTIGEVTTIINGGTPKSKVSEYWDGDVLWITPKDMGKLDSDYVSDTSRKISQLGLSKSSAKIIPKNSVILSTRAPIGHLAINIEPMATNQGCRGLVPSSFLDTKYLFYFLRKSVSLLNDIGSGTTFKELSKGALSGVVIPFPPLPEQKHIVAILDKAFEGIDTAIANTEKNLANARELFESYLHSIFVQKGKGWLQEKMSDVCTGNITDGTHQTPKYYEDGYIFLSSRNVTSRSIDWENIKYIDESQHVAMQKRLSPRLNDILLAKNGTTGYAAIVDRDVVFDIYVSLALLRPSEKILPRYLLHFVNSPIAKQQFNKRLKGIGVPNLHLKEIREVLVSFPEKISEQEIIVNKIDNLLVKQKRLESIYNKKLFTLSELKQSLLNKAFSGELTTIKDDELRTEEVA